ncbi:MAG TPA: hypothetical protein VD731_03380 [Nitrosopumilaceae archaeon]|nr:hypothetical protein [Nitrosopumilaceae archaeon]
MSISSYSTIVIGAGIFSFWGLYLAFTIMSIFAGAEGYPTMSDIRQMRSDLHFGLEKFFSNDENAITVFFMIPIAIFGSFVGIAISIVGFLRFAYQQANQLSPFPKKKKVSITWQIIASFFPGFSWWALYRINKLRIGLAIFAVEQVSEFAVFFKLVPYYEESLIVTLIFVIIYTGFVIIWSRDWNKALESKKVSKENTTVFTG